jgi:hypothetical protein
MSGGTWDHRDYCLQSLIDDITETMNEDWFEDEPEVIKRDLQMTKRDLEILYTKLHRLDYYLAGDDGLETYKKRKIEDLSNLMTGESK